jgi:acetolactate synthase-1/2/3 large subunit
MAKVSGGELLVRTLIKAGVKQTFGLHGAHLETLFQACLDHDIPILDTRHEVAAGHAAEAYARATNTLGVAMVTAGPGFTNCATSITNAYLDRTPVLYIAGSSGLAQAESNTLQAGFDQFAVAKPITKWTIRITVPEQIPRLVAEAVRIATSAPSGPVLLDMPSDVLGAQVDEEKAPIPETIVLDSPAAPTAAAVRQTLDILQAAKRPAIMLGAGAWRSGCGDELKTFVETTGIPVFSDFQAHGMLPSSDPRYGGTFHKMDDLRALDAQPDAVLALGVRFGLFTLGGSERLVPHSAKLIHVEVDPKEIGLVRDVTLPVVADSREMLKALNVAATKIKSWPDRGDFVRTIREARRKRFAQFDDAMDKGGPPMHPIQAVSAIVESIPKDTVIIGDGAEAYHWLNEVIRQDRGGSYITHGFLGTVGMGLGLSLGAQVANPNRRVLCLEGDGAVGFTITEFDTMTNHELPIVVLIMNNHSWGASQHFQEIVSGANRVTGTQLSDARYHDVAEAFGANGYHVTDVKALGPTIKEAFASGKPCCINVEIDLQPVPPEVGMLMSR